MKVDCKAFSMGFLGSFASQSGQNPETGQHFYALQARYAQRKGGDVSDPDQESYITPLNAEKLNVIINFVLKMAEQEAQEANRSQSRASALLANTVAAGAAVISAIAAVTAAILHH